MKKNLIVLLAVMITGMFSCKKEGPPGLDGQDGLNGSVPYVYYIDIPLNAFTREAYNGAWNTYATIGGLPIRDQDLAMVYVNLNSDGGDGDNYWQALPYIEYIGNTDVFIQHSFGIMDFNDDTGNNAYLEGDLMLSLTTSDGADPYDVMNSTALLKYNIFVIEGVEGKKATLPKHVDKNNISEVREYVKSIK